MIMQYGMSFTRIILEYGVARVSAHKVKLGKLSHKRAPAVAKMNHSNSSNNRWNDADVNIGSSFDKKTIASISLRSYSEASIKFLDEMSIGRTDFPDN
jgi:hypothetical protein